MVLLSCGADLQPAAAGAKRERADGVVRERRRQQEEPSSTSVARSVASTLSRPRLYLVQIAPVLHANKRVHHSCLGSIAFANSCPEKTRSQKQQPNHGQTHCPVGPAHSAAVNSVRPPVSQASLPVQELGRGPTPGPGYLIQDGWIFCGRNKSKSVQRE